MAVQASRFEHAFTRAGLGSAGTAVGAMYLMYRPQLAHAALADLCLVQPFASRSEQGRIGTTSTHAAGQAFHFEHAFTGAAPAVLE